MTDIPHCFTPRRTTCWLAGPDATARQGLWAHAGWGADALPEQAINASVRWPYPQGGANDAVAAGWGGPEARASR